MVGTPAHDLESSRGIKRKWTPREDEALVSCLVKLVNLGTHNTDIGFKAGYLGELEKMLLQKLPNCGLKGRPHIDSRLKTLKKEWSIVHEMIYGPHKKGFQWDQDWKMLKAENAIWDAYLVKHKDAAPFRFRAVPHFEDLTSVYVKDHVTGRHSRAALDILQEMDSGKQAGDSADEHKPLIDSNEEDDDFQKTSPSVDSMEDSFSPVDLQGSKRKNRMWNTTEDEALISSMVEMVTSFRSVNRGGFKCGYLEELERLLNKRLPNSGLKARPHIDSRLRTLKKDWNMVYDMIYGDTIGFQWDAAKKLVTADNAVWDAYLAKRKEAAPFRVRAFPHFEDLTLVYAKDQAKVKVKVKVNEERAVVLRDADLQREEEENTEGQADSQNATPDGDSVADQVQESLSNKSSSPNRKRKRSSVQDPIPSNVASSLVSEFREWRKDMGKWFGTDLMRQQIAEFTEAVEAVEGLTVDERLLAAYKIVERPPQMFLFLSLKPELRFKWIKMFLSKN